MAGDVCSGKKCLLSSWSGRSHLEVINLVGGVVLLPADLGHGLEGEVLLVVVDQPRRALRDVVQTEGEGDEEDEGSEAEPVPGHGAPHDVADDNAEGRHHLDNEVMMYDEDNEDMMYDEDNKENEDMMD